MKVVVYSAYFLTPVLERELEIITNHLEQGDDVTVVRCTRQLRSCLLNIKHRRSICRYCIAKFNRGYEVVGVPEECIQTLPPPPKSDYAEIPASFKDIDELKSWKYDGADIGMAVATTLMFYFNKDHRFNPGAHPVEVRNELNMSLFVYKSMYEKIRDIKPDVVYFFNGRHSTTRPVMRACERLGITFYTHERAGTFKRYTLRKNTLPHDFKVWGEDLLRIWADGGDDRDDFGAMFFRNKRERVEQRWFSMVKNQERGRLPEGFNKSRKNVVIYNSTLFEFEGMPGYENSIYADEIDGIKQICQSFEGDDRFQFYLRMHPNLSEQYRELTPDNNTQLRLIKEMEGMFDNLTIIQPDNPIDSYALLDSADKVVVFGSTVGVEAAFWGKPAILAGAGAIYRVLDCVYKPATHEEVVSLIKTDLKPKDKLEAIKYGYYEMMRGVPYKKFKQTGVLGGTFNGVKIIPGTFSRLLSYFLRVLEVRNRTELKAFLVDLRKMCSRF